MTHHCWLCHCQPLTHWNNQFTQCTVKTNNKWLQENLLLQDGQFCRVCLTTHSCRVVNVQKTKGTRSRESQKDQEVVNCPWQEDYQQDASLSVPDPSSWQLSYLQQIWPEERKSGAGLSTWSKLLLRTHFTQIDAGSVVKKTRQRKNNVFCCDKVCRERNTVVSS